MLEYRLYKLDANGRIAGVPLEFTCPCDEDAVQRAEQFRDGADLELWQRKRLVQRFEKLD